MLDLEAFTFLNRALESPLSPLVILASNRGNTHIRGGENLPPSAHGVPSDLLIIPTHPYGPAEIKSIITTRVQTEKLSISDAAKDKVSALGEKISLRYALQLLAPASVLADVSGRQGKQIQVEDVEECQDLFIDARRSAQNMAEANGFIA
jgi:RuvB-like protein 1 (pontin 52)